MVSRIFRVYGALRAAVLREVRATGKVTEKGREKVQTAHPRLHPPRALKRDIRKADFRI